MMMGKCFYDVPVYRLSREQYYKEMDKYVEKNLFSGGLYLKRMKEEEYRKEPSERVARENGLRKTFGGAWDFNEIIGYIRLYFFRTQIRGEYWGVDAKKIVKTRKKTFELNTIKLAPEIDLLREPDSSAIFSQILKYLEQCNGELKNRHIDSRNLEAIGPYVDWKLLFEESKCA